MKILLHKKKMCGTKQPNFKQVEIPKKRFDARKVCVKLTFLTRMNLYGKNLVKNVRKIVAHSWMSMIESWGLYQLHLLLASF